MTMKPDKPGRPRRVRIAELKAHLSKHLRAVRRGASIVVLDRETPIARIERYEAPQEMPPLPSRKPLRPGRLGDVPLPPPLDPPIDSLALLGELRQDRS